MILSIKRNTKALIRLCGCVGLSVPLLFATARRQVFSSRCQIYYYNLYASFYPLITMCTAHVECRLMSIRCQKECVGSQMVISCIITHDVIIIYMLFESYEHFAHWPWTTDWRTYSHSACGSKMYQYVKFDQNISCGSRVISIFTNLPW